jgi:hypothetical protein
LSVVNLNWRQRFPGSMSHLVVGIGVLGCAGRISKIMVCCVGVTHHQNNHHSTSPECSCSSSSTTSHTPPRHHAVLMKQHETDPKTATLSHDNNTMRRSNGKGLRTAERRRYRVGSSC